MSGRIKMGNSGFTFPRPKKKPVKAERKEVKRISTRSDKECRELATLWLQGEKEKVLEEMGEPTPKFLKDFGTSAEAPSEKGGAPKPEKVKKSRRKTSLQATNPAPSEEKENE